MLGAFFLIQALTGHPACADQGFDFDTFINVQGVGLNCHSGIPQKSSTETGFGAAFFLAGPLSTQQAQPQ